MPNTWPKERHVLGTRVQRLDGPDKATGRAKYSYDINLPGMLHAVMMHCPFAHAKLVSLDVAAAEKMPGVAAVYVCTGVEAGKKEFTFAGEEILAVAADTEEHARDAIRAVKIEYEPLEFFVHIEDAFKNPTKKTVTGGGASNLIVRNDGTKGDSDAAFKAADVIVEGEYGIGVICHQCLEAHGSVAHWEKDDQLTVYFSTQATTGVANALAGRFRGKIPTVQVKVITHYMGGGFGSKFGPDEWGFAAAELAKKTGKPVKLMLERAEEITIAGNRPSAYAKVKIGGTKDGKITAFEFDAWGSPGIGNAASVNYELLPYIYSESVANYKKKNTVIRLNAGNQRAFRAPGHPQNCMLTDTAVDDFAAKLGMDPMQVRLKNLPANIPGAQQNAPQSFNALRNTIWTDEFKIAAEKSDWAKKWHPPGKGPSTGPVKHGIGMAIHTWGGGGNRSNDVTITITSDGTAQVQCSTQDLGTGERTVLAIVTAEILGLKPEQISTRIGESPFGRSTGSGGSTTCPGTSPAALNAGIAARDALFEKIAARLDAKQENLTIEPGFVVDKAKNKKWPWKEACSKLGADSVRGVGDHPTPADNAKLLQSNNGVGGVQIAEVMVDTETGVVRVTRWVAVQDCGLIVNLQGCESQVAGGVVMGINYALFEERIMDRHTGRQVNPDMEFYKLAGLVDIPEIIVHMHDMPERGVIGIGEPSTVSTAAALGNAIHNALGVRVPFAPYTPDRVLAALAAKGGKG